MTKLTMVSVRISAARDGKGWATRFVECPVDEDGRVRLTMGQVHDLMDSPPERRHGGHVSPVHRLNGVY